MLGRTIDYAGQGKRGESPKRELSLKIVWETACKKWASGGGVKEEGGLNKVANS